MTRLLLTGAGGQVGWELARCLLPLGEVLVPPRAEFDLSRPDQCAGFIARVRPDVVVNPAAYTAVDKAEAEPELALCINGDAPAAMARAAQGVGALFIHYSTDYVFDGTKAAPYVEDDEPRPRSTYGRSKLAGEEGVRASGADYLILRTSWVYAARGHNFLRTMLRLAAERDELRVVADQIGAPTWARLIADATAHALRESQRLRSAGRFESGLYHLTAQGETSWHGFASRIVELARGMSLPVKARGVAPIATADYPLPAPRPANSRMDGTRFMTRFGLELPSWERCLELAMQEVTRVG